MKTELLHLINLRFKNWFKMHGQELQKEWWGTLFKRRIAFFLKKERERERFYSKPKYCLWLFFRSSGVDSAVYFPDQHINFRSVTPARQPESMNLKASKSMDLGKWGWGDIQVSSPTSAHLSSQMSCLCFFSSNLRGQGLPKPAGWDNGRPIFLSSLTHLIVITPI